MKVACKAQLAGRFQLTITDGERGTIEYPWMDNLITDLGLNGLVKTDTIAQATTSALTFFGVGESSQVPSVSDTGLISPRARAAAQSTPQRGYNTDEGYGWSRSSATFARGTAAGNLAEVATFFANNNTTAFARALLRDEDGEPTVITVLPDEVVVLTWELRRWWSTTPHLVEYMDDGVPASTTVTIGAAMSYAGLASGGDKSWGNFSSLPWPALVSTGVARRPVFFNESQGNPQIASTTAPLSDGAGSIFPNAFNGVTFSPPIPKTNEFTVSIVFELQVERRTPVD